jgi:Zn-dependent peptidase ImmA (M78 family)
MDEMIVAHINGQMLAWARRRAGIDLNHLARLAKGKITAEKLSAWENGDEFPSQAQAIILAEKLGISYAMLFMPTVPPPDNPTIPDLRTLSGTPLTDPSLDFRQVLNDATVRQEWIRDERIDENWEPLTFVGKFNTGDDPKLVVADMRRVLQLTNAERSRCNDYDEFLKHLVARAEDIGVLVMRSAVVRHATNRPLLVKEFRGFALNDIFAPVVFINDADAKAAQIFTIVHELAHVWIGADGVSDRRPNQKDESKNSIELFCDRVAAELLAPEAEVMAMWGGGVSLENSKRLATHFRVSTLVILRRAKDLGLLPFDTFMRQVESEYERFREIDRRKREQQKKKKDKGGNFWATFELRNGKTFNATVAACLQNRRVSFTEGATLLGITIASTVRYLRRIGAY